MTEPARNDTGLAERLVAYRQATGKTWAQICRELNYDTGSNYSPQTLRIYAHQKHFKNCDKFEKSLLQYLERRESLLKMSGQKKFYRSLVFQIIAGGLRLAKENNAIVVLVGPAGIGKTFSIKHWLNQNGHHSIYLTAHTQIQPKALVVKIAEALGLAGVGTISAQLDQIITKINSLGKHLIIVDEANYLNARAVDTLRYIYDHSPCGLVFIGTEQLVFNLKKKNRYGRAELEQFASRVDFFQVLPGCKDLIDEFLKEQFGTLPPEIISTIKEHIGPAHAISFRRLEKLTANIKRIMSGERVSLSKEVVQTAAMTLMA